MKIIVNVFDIPIDPVQYFINTMESLDFVTYATVENGYSMVIITKPDKDLHPAQFTYIGGALATFLIAVDLLDFRNTGKVTITFDDGSILDIFEDMDFQKY